MIDIESILVDSIVSELESLQDEESLTSVLELVGVIKSSGLYMFLTNEMLETYSDFIANKLPVRRFVIGITERFIMKLNLAAPDPTTSSIFVGEVMSGLIAVASNTRENLTLDNSVIIPEIQSNLELTEKTVVLRSNWPYLILYLAEATSAFKKALTKIDNV